MSALTREQRWSRGLFSACAALVLTLCGTVQILGGERFAGHGIGKGDSRYYSWLAQEFESVAGGGQLDRYRLQRILPSGLVYTALGALGLPRDDRWIVRAFAALNLVALLVTLVAWIRIADHRRLSTAGRWLGGLLLFGGFAALRGAFYSPVTTDFVALALGAVLIDAYLRDSPVLMLGTLAAASLTWPALVPLGGLLFVWPPRRLETAEGGRQRWAIAGLAVVVFLMLLRAAMPGPWPDRQEGPAPLTGWGQVWLHEEWLWASIPLALVGVFGGTAGLFRGVRLAELRRRATELRPGRLAWLVAMGVGVNAVLTRFDSGAAPANTLGILLPSIAGQSILRPGQPLVAHVVYFGLLPLLLLVYWDRVCRAAHGLGIGFTLYTASLLGLGLSSESRQLSHGLPALVLLAVLAVEDVRWPRWAPWVAAGLALLGSKLWFGINHEGFVSSNHPFSYPAQFYYMHVGPWMADEMYALQGSLALAALLVVWLVRRGERPIPEAQRDVVWPSNRTVLAVAGATVLPIAVPVLLASGIELAARWVVSSRLASQRAEPLSRPHDSLGWENVPGARATLAGLGWTTPIEINGHGLRGPERGYAKPPGRKRVLLLGGSFAEGYAVREEHTVRAVLEGRLEHAGCGPVEVINGGVADYTALQQSRFYQSQGRRYGAELVVLVFHHEDLSNWLRWGESSEDVGAPTALRQPRRRELQRWHGSAALRLLSNTTFEHVPGLHRWLGGHGIVEYGPPPRELWPFGPREQAEGAWRRWRREIDTLSTAVVTDGGRLMVLYAPARFELDEADWAWRLARYRMSDRFWRVERAPQRAQRIVADLAVEWVDPRAALAEPSGGLAGYTRDGLWNAVGHDVAARELLAPVSRALGCGGPPP